MFRNLIYFDSKKVMDYRSILEGKKYVSIKNIKVSSEKSLAAKMPVISGGIGGASEMDGEILENLLLDCEEFESLLEKKNRNDYFDFTIDNFDAETIPKSAIIRFEGKFIIPEEFDMMDLINKFKPMLATNMNLQNSQEEEIFGSLFGKESTKIPAFIECDNFEDRVGFAKFNSNNLCYELESLEDYEEEDVTILAKVLSKKEANNRPIIVFDIMKDLFSLGRGIRRQMGSQEIEGIENIKTDKNIIILEVLAIYQ
ncbi:hypothetical protein [Psychrobacillus sp. L4]|uniref:DUF6414 family protein n=1 Tax=Psychrobacillus sp. L4 TaxID=3236892 RepID=UPI0036F202A5